MKNWKQQIYKKRKLIFYGLVTLILLFANYKLFFRPTIGSLIKTWPQVTNLQRRVDTARSAIANIPGYKRQIEELRGRLSLYQKKFSTEQEISFLLKELSKMAEDSGVKIVAIKPHQVTTEIQQDAYAGTYQKFPISIRASCGYHQLGTFLNKLENAETFIRVSNIRITGSADDSTEHQVYILANTYILTETKTAKTESL